MHITTNVDIYVEPCSTEVGDAEGCGIDTRILVSGCLNKNIEIKIKIKLFQLSKNKFFWLLEWMK